jgi:hypothetical protein
VRWKVGKEGGGKLKGGKGKVKGGEGWEGWRGKGSRMDSGENVGRSEVEKWEGGLRESGKWVERK